MSEEQYYIKEGRRYKPVKPWRGFPKDGVWVIKDAGKMSRFMLKLPDGPVESNVLASLGRNKDALSHVITKYLMDDKARSIQELADAIAEDLLINYGNKK